MPTTEMNIDALVVEQTFNDCYFAAAEVQIERIPLGEDSENFLVCERTALGWMSSGRERSKRW